MSDESSAEGDKMVREIKGLLMRLDAGAGADSRAEELAREWVAAGFEDAEEVSAWLEARCNTPRDAQALETAGITPEQAAIRTRAGSAGYSDTIAYKIAHKDLSIEEARRIITSAFWND